jgi:hypothetical protein
MIQYTCMICTTPTYTIYICSIYMNILYVYIYILYIYILYIYILYIIIYSYCIYVFIYIYHIHITDREREGDMSVLVKIMSISHCPGTPPMRSRKFPWRLCSSCDPAVPRGWEKKRSNGNTAV